jgi:hypothetical protein
LFDYSRTKFYYILFAFELLFKQSNSNMKVKIKRWHGVAVWKWDVDDDVCGICRMPFEACCPGAKYPGDDCPPGRW